MVSVSVTTLIISLTPTVIVTPAILLAVVLALLDIRGSVSNVLTRLLPLSMELVHAQTTIFSTEMGNAMNVKLLDATAVSLLITHSVLSVLTTTGQTS